MKLFSQIATGVKGLADNITGAVKRARDPAYRLPRRGISLQTKMARHGYVFVLPFLLGFAIVFLPVIFESIRLSFSDLRMNTRPGMAPYSLTPVGWTNYEYAVAKDPDFNRLVFTTISQMVLDIPVIVIFSLFIATILNQRMVGRGFFRAVFFIPVILATGIVAKAEIGNYVMNAVVSDGVDFGTDGSNIAAMGGIQNYLWGIGVGQDLIGFVMGAVQNIYDVINHAGVQILLFLAGLQSISPSIYESASIEGATGWEAFWKITFPMISPVILVNVVYSVIDALTREDNAIMMKITAMERTGKQAIGASMSWIYFVLVLALIGIVFGVLSRLTFYQQRD